MADAPPPLDADDDEVDAGAQERAVFLLDVRPELFETDEPGKGTRGEVAARLVLDFVRGRLLEKSKDLVALVACGDGRGGAAAVTILPLGPPNAKGARLLQEAQSAGAFRTAAGVEGGEIPSATFFVAMPPSGASRGPAAGCHVDIPKGWSRRRGDVVATRTVNQTQRHDASFGRFLRRRTAGVALVLTPQKRKRDLERLAGTAGAFGAWLEKLGGSRGVTASHRGQLKNGLERCAREFEDYKKAPNALDAVYVFSAASAPCDSDEAAVCETWARDSADVDREVQLYYFPKEPFDLDAFWRPRVLEASAAPGDAPGGRQTSRRLRDASGRIAAAPRGRDVDIPWRRVAATPRPGRGYSEGKACVLERRGQ